MAYRIILARCRDTSVMAEVPCLPGVIATGMTREAAIDEIKELARTVLADRAERLGGLLDEVDFEIEPGGPLVEQWDDIKAAIQSQVSSEALAQGAQDFHDPVSEPVNATEAVLDSLGRPAPRTRGARAVRDELVTSGWVLVQQEHSSDRYALLERSGRELVFPFGENDVVRNEVLDRIEQLGGLAPESQP